MSKETPDKNGKAYQNRKRKCANGDDTVPSEGKHAKTDAKKSERIITDINVEGFVESRALEIQALTDVVKNIGGNHQAFQKLPRHMRRRAMSHNIKRVPRRLHGIVKSELEKTKAPGKRPSRRYRRRPSNLLAEYERRKRRIGWLETHIWHAKRFKMVEKWGHKLAVRPSDKSERACYRAVSKHCLLQDVSYEKYIEIKGSRQRIISGLAHLTSDKLGTTFASRMTALGLRQGKVTLYSYNSYPYCVIGPVTYLWRPQSTENNLQDQQTPSALWICCHPSFYIQVWNEINKCFDKTVKRDPEMSSQATTSATNEDEESEVSVASLKDQLNKFRLLGPASNVVLAEVLQVAKVETRDNSLNMQVSDSGKVCTGGHTASSNKSDTTLGKKEQPVPPNEKNVGERDDQPIQYWWKEFYSENENLKSFQEQADLWSKLTKCHSPAESPPNCVLSLTVKDPRVLLPPKRNKVYTVNSGTVNNSLPLELFSASIANSPVWDDHVRLEVKTTKMSENKLNEMKSKQLIPGTSLSLGEEESRVPVMLIQRPGASSSHRSSSQSCCDGYASGWDIIIPAGWAMAFWVALVYRGARVGGLREACSTALFANLPCEPYDFPDSEAGKAELKGESETRQSKHDRRPPAKRPNYTKLGFASPFKFEFDRLINEWQSKCHEMVLNVNTAIQMSEKLEVNGTGRGFYVLREVKLLRILNSFLTDIKGFMKSKGKNSGKGKGDNKVCVTALEKLLFSEAGKTLVEQHSSALVPVNLNVLHRGVPSMFGHICSPLLGDLKQLDCDKNYGGPCEEKHKDPYQAQRKEERKQRLTLRKQKKRGEKRTKDIKTQPCANAVSSSEGSSAVEQKAITAAKETERISEKVEGSCKEMTDSNGNRMDTEESHSISLLDHTIRPIIGFVRNGDFDLGRGQGSGLGFCSVLALLYLLKLQQDRKSCRVLIRNPTSLQYRFASISIAL